MAPFIPDIIKSSHGLVVKAVDSRPRGHGFESRWHQILDGVMFDYYTRHHKRLTLKRLQCLIVGHKNKKMSPNRTCCRKFAQLKVLSIKCPLIVPAVAMSL